MGAVVRTSSDAAVIAPSEAVAAAPLKAGDGVVFDAASWRSPAEKEEGGRVYAVSAQRDGNLIVRFGNRDVDFNRVRPGDLLWRTHDPELDRVVRPFLEAATPLARQDVHVHVAAREGFPLEARWSLVSNPDVSVSVQSAGALGSAATRVLDAEFLREQLGRLGNTPYRLASLSAEFEGSPFAPASMLNALRREAIDLLQARQSQLPRRTTHDPDAMVERALAGRRKVSFEPPDAQLHLLVRTPEQLEAAIDFRPASITLDYLDLYGLKPSVERVNACGISVRVATPRVMKPGEERVLDFLLRLDCPLLVRAAGLLDTLKNRPQVALTGDFSLNAANSLTADSLLQMGLERITPTHDLNADQVAALAASAGGANIEAIVYQHLPVFHTEHCVFCRFLSEGTTFHDCGRPCEKHRVAVRDNTGRSHPVMADVGCRNTVFGAEAQEASLHLDKWRRAGIAHFRLEFVHESGSQVKRVSEAFRQYFSGRLEPAGLHSALRAASPQGTTEGSLFVPKDYLTLPVLQ